MYATNRHRAIFSLKEKFTHRRTLEVLAEFNKTQWYSPETIRQMQWEKFCRLIGYAYENVPYYREQFKKIGLVPSDLKDFNDIRNIPILTKDDIREHSDSLKALNFKGHETTCKTSGSTGMPLIFPVDQEAASHHGANQIRGRSWWGIKIGDKELKFWGVSTPFQTTVRGKLVSLVKRMKDKMLSSIHLSPFDSSHETFLRYHQIMLEALPKLIFGYGVALYIFAKFIKDNGLDLDSYRPDAVIYTSETLYPSQKALIEEVFGRKVACEYGSVECGIIAYECPAGSLHISDETLYLEIVENPDKGLTDGLGEVVVTHLAKYSFPFIRYKLGDIGAISSKQCSCGRGLRVLESLLGRCNDLIMKPNGEPIHAELFDYIMRQQQSVRRYRIIEEAIGHLRILLETDEKLSSAQKENLHSQFINYIGSDFKISIEEVDYLSNDASGKFRWVIALAGSKTR